MDVTNKSGNIHCKSKIMFYISNTNLKPVGAPKTQQLKKMINSFHPQGFECD
uniref:Uncharacterized protein n=1 Tax=Schistosoma haematobium TaxID=6185 RepID=A0A094ZLU0_SCHHA